MCNTQRPFSNAFNTVVLFDRNFSWMLSGLAKNGKNQSCVGSSCNTAARSCNQTILPVSHERYSVSAN